jgi:hypothetical protein
VLHFVPSVVEMLGGFTGSGNIELRLGVAENLLAFEKFLLGCVLQLRFVCILALSANSRGGKRKGQRKALPT